MSSKPSPSLSPPLFHYLSTSLLLVFYNILYYLLHLIYLLHPNAPAQSSSKSPSYPPPPHIALSGPLSEHPSTLSHVTAHIISTGVSSITIHDPWTSFKLPHIIPILSSSVPDDMHCTIRILHSDGTATSQQIPTSTTPSKPLQPKKTACITLVQPGAGRGAIVRAARRLCQGQDGGSVGMKVDEVTDWIDAEEGMLRSEPDVLVVFAPEGRGKVLYGFPVWQLRLTQIRFLEKEICEINGGEVVDLVCSAASAPKRFGT